MENLFSSLFPSLYEHISCHFHRHFFSEIKVGQSIRCDFAPDSGLPAGSNKFEVIATAAAPETGRWLIVTYFWTTAKKKAFLKALEEEFPKKSGRKRTLEDVERKRGNIALYPGGRVRIPGDAETVARFTNPRPASPFVDDDKEEDQIEESDDLLLKPAAK